jgi:hypothetical protein
MQCLMLVLCIETLVYRLTSTAYVCYNETTRTPNMDNRMKRHAPSIPPAVAAAALTKPHVYNPHWKGYSFLLLSSLLNLSSCSNIPKDGNFHYRGDRGVAVCFGSVTFAMSLIILVLDRTQFLVNTFHFTTAGKGQLEGFVLLSLTAWWIVGVAYQTQVQGIAYTVLNVYFSAWLSLASVLYTLNQWSSKRDLLSWHEVTGVSATLKSWYILWIASVVVFGTSLNFHVLNFDNGVNVRADGASAAVVVVGFVSLVLSLGFIMVHYRLIEFCATGGLTEILTALGLLVLWIVGVAVVTQEGAIGATISGRGCSTAFWELMQAQNAMTNSTDTSVQDLAPESADGELCRVLVVLPHPSGNQTDALVNVTVACNKLYETTFPGVRLVPGSNLYLAVWTCLAATIHLLLRWKAQQALQFAQAQQESKRNKDDNGEQHSDSNNDFEKGELSFSPDDDDLDEFIDAVN